MTLNDAYEYLGTVRRMTRNLERLNEHITELRYSLLPGAIRYDKDRVNTSPKDTLADTFDDIIELETEYMQMAEQRTATALKLFQEIGLLPVGKERSFLLKYYVRCEKMEQISDDLNITLRHCYRIRRKAVLMFSESQRKI